MTIECIKPVTYGFRVSTVIRAGIDDEFTWESQCSRKTSDNILAPTRELFTFSTVELFKLIFHSFGIRPIRTNYSQTKKSAVDGTRRQEDPLDVYLMERSNWIFDFLVSRVKNLPSVVSEPWKKQAYIPVRHHCDLSFHCPHHSSSITSCIVTWLTRKQSENALCF